MRTKRLLSTYEVEWPIDDGNLEFRVEIFEIKTEINSIYFGRVFRYDAYRLTPIWPSLSKTEPIIANETWLVLDGMFDGVALKSDDPDSAFGEILSLIDEQFKAPSKQ